MAQEETARASVYLDDKQAQAAVDGLIQKGKELKETLKEAYSSGDTKQIKKIESALKQNRSQIRSLKKETYDYEKVLRNLNGASYNELNKALRTVLNQQRKLKRSDSGYNEKRLQVKALRAEIQKLNQDNQIQESRWSKVATGVNKYMGVVTGAIAIITTWGYSVSQIISGLVGLDDQLANVMKTTGLSRKEVRGLYSDFSNLNTRTSKQELLEFAEEAGRLGKKSKEDVMAFVDVANQIGVALGDDLGGNAAEATRQVGKLSDIYKVGEQYGGNFGTSMAKIGSAINEVSANSSANASYQIDYLKRLGGTATQAKVTAAEILGYSSVLDQNGQAVEMAATAQGKILVDMFTDQASYAKVAKMSITEFSNLLKTDANEAFLKFLQGLNGNNEGFDIMASKLDALGISGSRTIQVLSVMAQNTDNIRQQQELANGAMVDGISLSKEYEIKNNNLAGSWAKITKTVRSFFVNTQLIEFFEGIIISTAENMDKLIIQLTNFVRILKVVTIATLGYLAAKKSVLSYDRLHYSLLVAKSIATKAYAVVTGLLTGKIKLATLATRSFNTAQKANIIGAVVGILLAAIAAWQSYSDSVKEAISKEKSYRRVASEARIQSKAAATQLALYRKQLIETEPQSEARIKLVKELNEKYPDLLKNIDAEVASISELNTAFSKYTANLEEIIRLKVLSSELETFVEEERDIEKRFRNGDIEYSEKEDEQQKLDKRKANLLRELEYQKNVVDFGKKTASLIQEKKDIEAFLAESNYYHKKKLLDFETLDKGQIRNLLISQAKNGYEVDTSDAGVEKMYQEQLKEVDAFDAKFKDKVSKLADIKESLSIQTPAINASDKPVGLGDDIDNSTRLEAIELAFIEEQNLLKSQYYKTKITEKEYQKQRLQNEIDFLDKKAALTTNQKGKVQVQSQKLDKEIELQKLNAAADKEKAAELKKAKDLLEQYESYLQKRARLQKEYEAKRIQIKKAGGTDENIEMVNNEESAALSEIDDKIAAQEDSFNSWANGILKLGLTELKSALTKAKVLLIAKSNSETSEEDLAILRAKIDALENQIDQAETESGGKTKNNFKDTLEIMNEVNSTTKDMVSQFGDLDETTEVALSAATNISGGIIGMLLGLQTLAATGEEALKGVEKASVILAIVSASIQIVIAIFDLFKGSHDKTKEKEIESLQESVDSLSDSYDKLNTAIEKAYSQDASQLIDSQNQNLAAQKALIENQITAEEAKKNPDRERVNDWNQALSDIDTQIEENKEKAIDVIFGADVQSAIEEFADAYLNAFAGGEDRAKAQKEVVRNMIKGMVEEIIKSNITDKVIELREKLQSAIKDGVISESEQADITKIEDAIYSQSEKDAQAFEEYLKDQDTTSQQSGTSGGYETLSQETGSELLGRNTAIHFEVTKIGIELMEMKGLCLISIAHLSDIAKNTKELYQINERIGKLVKLMEKL